MGGKASRKSGGRVGAAKRLGGVSDDPEHRSKACLKLTVRRTPSTKEMAPEATAALYSPDECPRMAEALEATGVAKSL